MFRPYAVRLATVRFILISIGLSAGSHVQSVHGANEWPNWRGPHADGSSEGGNPPIEWSSTQNIRWKVPIPGKGSGSPIIWEDQIILLAAIDTGEKEDASPNVSSPDVQPAGSQGGRGGGRGARSVPTSIHEFVVLSYHVKDGKERWRTVVKRAVPHEGGHQTNSHASASAVTDGEKIFASFGSHGIYGLDMEGKLLWSKELGKMQTRNQFGEGASPALAGNRLLVPWDHEGTSALFALDARSGDILWKTDRKEPTTWATPLPVEFGGQTQVVTNGTTVRSYDITTGELLWACGGQVTNPIPTPVRVDDAVVCMTGYRGNAIYAMPLDARGDISQSDKILWSNHDAAPYVSSPTLYKGQLYFTKDRSGVMSSIEAKTGKVLIPPTRLSKIADVYASPVSTHDKIYFTGRDGVTVVIRHGDKLQEIAVNELGEPVDASPALVGDQIILRGTEHLYSIAEVH